ncbi:DEAH-box RNA helicase-like protein [Pleomassaria siparia CBS 279.74]|uniref:RNA helicase n=1 Tax=Pleomassaria siparia CBS 279.74 TaxID=1314801 RepID=A0A6G1KCX5_9PLEO|nr:DEAH-box RNA helicase-like protein [Pleomassaria siparia CBS 279.74]
MPKFVPRLRKHRAIAREKLQANAPREDTSSRDANATEILPAEKREREERKLAMREELVKEASSKMSGKKKKRLDKYIDTKLKKEENLVLLKKLAAQKVDTSLFQSSKKLGRGDETKREMLRRALLERNAGIDVEKNEGLLLEERQTPDPRSIPRNRDVARGTEEKVEAIPRTRPKKQHETRDASPNSSQNRGQSPTTIGEEPVATTSQESVSYTLPGAGLFGTGLKRPLELDETGNPVIQTRKRRKGQKKAVVIEEEVEWEGFSSDEDVDGTASSDSAESDDASSDEEDSGSGDSENDSDDDESDTSLDEETKALRRNRASAFKSWATQQRNEVVGFVPSTNLTYAMPPTPANFAARAPEADPLPPELETNTATDATRKAFSVTVDRSPEIQESRLQLPIVAEEQKIMEAIHNHDVVVVWGATGSGKTTQVPQFLFEAGYGAPDGPTPGLIGVTQPRRVAAVSMSKRVSDELGDAGSKVAYQIRFDTTTNPKTAIKFMTDGVLLREISQDFILTKYSAIVIDEAHERSVNTDILIGMLSRIVDLRAEMARDDPKQRPLKLVIMSATLRISDFTGNKRLFRNTAPPLIKAEGRQFTVTTHFSRRTQRDYVEEAFQKVCRGHRKLPQGGMLVFLTGQNEIAHLAKKLKETFASSQGHEAKVGQVQISPAEAPLETEDIELGKKDSDYQDDDGSDSDDSVIMGVDNDEDDAEFEIGEEKAESSVLKVHVLPLYSQLPTNQQLRVFDPPPEGSRLIVLATNVAETSLTIPGIRYVFDCGRAKEKKYDLITGVQSFEVGWISKASASQRAGRAGRTGPGHCYRLYSSAVYERDFEEYAAPEILRTPLESIVLQLKSMGAPVSNFPFPTPPDRANLLKAESLLSYLGALSSSGKVTPLGHELSLYPLNPRFARMLVMGIAQNLAAQTIALVAALSVPELIIPENKLGLHTPKAVLPTIVDEDENGVRRAPIRTEEDNLADAERSRLRKAYNAAQGKLSANAGQADCMKLNAAICAYAHESNPDEFCDDMFLNAKSMHEATLLRQQLTTIIRAHRPTSLGAYTAQLPPPTEKNINLLRQICAAGFIDQIAMRADLAPFPPELGRKPKSAVDVPYVTLFPSTLDRAKGDDAGAACVYLHPSSLLSRTPPSKLPGFLVYSHLQRAAPSSINASRTPKTRFHALTPVTRNQIINMTLGTPLLSVSKPKGTIVDMERGKRECEVELSLVGESGSQGWGLGVRRVVQRKEGSVWVVDGIVG